MFFLSSPTAVLTLLSPYDLAVERLPNTEVRLLLPLALARSSLPTIVVTLPLPCTPASFDQKCFGATLLPSPSTLVRLLLPTELTLLPLPNTLLMLRLGAKAPSRPEFGAGGAPVTSFLLSSPKVFASTTLPRALAELRLPITRFSAPRP